MAETLPFADCVADCGCGGSCPECWPRNRAYLYRAYLFKARSDNADLLAVTVRLANALKASVYEDGAGYEHLLGCSCQFEPGGNSCHECERVGEALADLPESVRAEMEKA